jgi:hypothetical protein
MKIKITWNKVLGFRQKLSGKKFTDSLGFPLALAAFANSTRGLDGWLEWGLTAFTGLMAIILLFEKVFANEKWNSFVKWVEEYDFGYLVFGLGLMTGGAAITSNHWGIILFMVAGAGFVAVAIGRMNGRQMAKIAIQNPHSAIDVGKMVLIVAVAWTIVRKSEIVKNYWGVDAQQVYWLVAMGILYGIAGLIMRRRQNNPIPTPAFDFQI